MLCAIISCFLLINPPAEVSGLNVADTTYNTAEIRWEESDNAKGYSVYRSEDGENYEYLTDTEDTVFHDSELTTGRKYYYAVSAYNGIRRQNLDRDKAVFAEPSLETPSFKISTKKGKVQLKIEEVEGATGYEIFRNDEMIREQPETTFVDAEAEGDETYLYAVKAVREQEETAYSDLSNEVSAKLVTVGDMKAEVENDDLHITWEASDDYSTFRLMEGKETLTETDGTEYTIENFDKDKVYELTLIGEEGKARSPEKTQVFAIREEAMSNEDAIDAACKWAVKIADDDSFTYGECPNALHYGCYFCKTNGKKGKGYEKTYICNALVHAAYAHGAGDKAMLKACKSGSGIGMTEESFKRYGNWKNEGKPSADKLKKGDVLVANRDMGESDFHHVAMYIGDGKIVQATRKGWSEESISTRSLSGDYYGRFDFVMRYTGKGGGSVYTAEDITEERAEDQ